MVLDLKVVSVPNWDTGIGEGLRGLCGSAPEGVGSLPGWDTGMGKGLRGLWVLDLRVLECPKLGYRDGKRSERTP